MPTPGAAAASPGNLLEMQILGVHPRPPESETLGWGPAVCVLSSPGDPAAGSSSQFTDQRTMIPARDQAWRRETWFKSVPTSWPKWVLVILSRPQCVHLLRGEGTRTLLAQLFWAPAWIDFSFLRVLRFQGTVSGQEGQTQLAGPLLAGGARSRSHMRPQGSIPCTTVGCLLLSHWCSPSPLLHSGPMALQVQKESGQGGWGTATGSSLHEEAAGG